MNDTEYVFMAIIAFGIGYGIAHFFKNIGKLWRKWGGIICYFAFPVIVYVLIGGAAMIADMRDVIISSIFAAGFVIRMIKRNA